MNFIKKQAAGFYLTLLAMILGTAGVVFYVINCNTAYFSNLGISWGVVGCLVAGSSSGTALCGRTGEITGTAGVGYPSGSGRGAVNGGICIFRPPESQQYCDDFIIRKKCADHGRSVQCNHWDGVCSGSSYHDNYLFIFPNSKRRIEKSEGCLITGTLILTFENGLGILKENNR